MNKKTASKSNGKPAARSPRASASVRGLPSSSPKASKKTAAPAKSASVGRKSGSATSGKKAGATKSAPPQKKSAAVAKTAAISKRAAPARSAAPAKSAAISKSGAAKNVGAAANSGPTRTFTGSRADSRSTVATADAPFDRNIFATISTASPRSAVPSHSQNGARPTGGAAGRDESHASHAMSTKSSPPSRPPSSSPSSPPPPSGSRPPPPRSDAEGLEGSVPPPPHVSGAGELLPKASSGASGDLADRIVAAADTGAVMTHAEHLMSDKPTSATAAARVLEELLARKPEMLVPVIDKLVHVVTTGPKRSVQTAAAALPVMARLAPARVARHLPLLTDRFAASSDEGKNGLVSTFAALCTASVAYQKRLEPVLGLALSSADPKTLQRWTEIVLPSLKGEPHARARAVVEDRLHQIPRQLAQPIATFLGIKLRPAAPR
jgi:hypothetical protein